MDPADKQHVADDAEIFELHASPVIRAVLVGCGILAVALGVIGIFLPVLPTTPFLLLAAACFARASPKLYRWLAQSRTFGPYLREWRLYRSVPWRAKVFALALMSVSIAVSTIFFVDPPWAKALLVALGVVVGVWLYRIPSRDAPRAGGLLRR
jgi:uncharacterized membrane protein YbaN (DUF454 family)